GKITCSLDRNFILGTAALKYTLSQKTSVDISFVNILGQKVASLDNGEKESGEHNISISTENLSQGIYYIVIETANGQKGITKAAVLK
ncbi:MAG: T9SS type A sorting domain-containing protein, partial [candidate division WOR-3 bacterium]